MIKFNAKYLKTLLSFVAKNDIRYYLAGIYVEPHPDGGAILVATDGHMMAVIRDADAVCTEPAVLKLSADASKFAGPSMTWVRAGHRQHKESAPHYVQFNPITDRLIITGQGGDELFVQPGKASIQNAKYPDWRRVVPKFSVLKPGMTNMVAPKDAEGTLRSSSEVEMERPSVLARKARCSDSRPIA